MNKLRPETPQPPVAADGEFIEPCDKCKGKGLRWFELGSPPQACNTCKGAGYRMFKESAEKRAHTRNLAKARKALKLAEKIAAFTAEYPSIVAWMKRGGFPFAVAMRATLAKYGGLTDKQLAASIKCVRQHG